MGVSFDTQEENSAFAVENSFPYRLLSDVDRNVSGAYGARRPDDHEWASVPRRISYLIDPEGRVAKAYLVKDIAAHVDEVMTDLQELRSP